ncbi:MAG: hypothetical protein P1S60_16580, partial [Anaerolineae bacterium]|nr:hypothetical protein [Anaerolineae bacterium]
FHTWYEMLHTLLYKDMTSLNYASFIWMIFVSAVADAVITWALFLTGVIIRHGRGDWRPPWHWKTTAIVIVLAFVGQAVGEYYALRTGRWAYILQMPTVSFMGVGLGLTPLLQMPCLVPITLWLASRAHTNNLNKMNLSS